ncbi:MAG: outer membrane protein transport protein [Hyphomicrobiaceae bacterium]|nr:outer membrane protein transport protein [Hyphomicrobiaceae bacterium]
MSVTKKYLWMSSVALVGAALMTAQAQAGAFGTRQQSGYYLGQAYAGVGAPGPSISGMYWNPAVVTTAKVRTSESHHSLVWSSVDIQQTNLGGTGSASSDTFGWIPTSYTAIPLNNGFFVGLHTAAPYGSLTKYQNPWGTGGTGSFYAATSQVRSINLNAIVGYQFSDQLSVAAGLQAQYFSVRFTRGIPGGLELKGNDWGFGFTAGVTYKPVAGTEIGIGYRSAIEHDIGGKFSAPALLVPRGTKVTADITLPQMATIGIRQKINDQWTVSASAEWVGWSSLGPTPIVAKANGATLTTLNNFNYDDGWYFAIGAEYKYSESLTFRAGVGYEISPIPDHIRTMGVPDADRLWLSAGATYNYSSRLSFDLAYTHINTISATYDLSSVAANPNANPLAPFTGKSDTNINIIGLAVRYKWDEPPKAEPLPVNAKF